MKTLVLFVAMTGAVNADVSCIETSTITTCSNGMTAYQLGNMTQYNMPNGQNMTIWNTNTNRYQEVPVIQPVQPIAPITPVPSFRVFEPLN